MVKRIQIIDFLKEIAIVVIGVLIAVSLSNYKERIDNNDYLNTTLSAIKEEVLSNKQELERVLQRHIELQQKFDSEFNENGQTIGEFVSISGGFQAASVKNISLRFFISNKAELLDYQMISQLSEIETQKKLLEDKLERFVDFGYDHSTENSEEIRLKFSYLLANVIDGEQTLLESYTELLENNSYHFKKLND